MELTTLINKIDGRRVQCVTCQDCPEGFWARPVGCAVRFFFSRDEWRYQIRN